METQRNWRWGMQLLLGLMLSFLFFFMMAPFLIPILLGAMIALLCYPTFKRLNHKLPPPVSAGVVTAGVTTGVLVPVVFMLVKGSYQVLNALKKAKFPTAEEHSGVLAYPTVRSVIAWISRFSPMDREWLQGQLLDLIQSVVSHISAWVGNFLASMPNLILVFFIMTISFYFFLLDGSRFLKFLSTLSPLGEQRSGQLYHAFENSCRGVVMGLFSSAAIQGVLILLFFSITGVPNAILFGTIGIFMGMVPVVGTAPVTLGGILYLFSLGHQWGAIVLIVGAVVIAAIDNIVRSWILKGASEMHPLLALISALGATAWLGPPGIFLGPIIAAVFLSFLSILSVELNDGQKLTGP